MSRWRSRASNRFVAMAWIFMVLAGCADRETVRVRLQVRPVASGSLTQLDIQAQIAGPQAGLTYKWFAVSGSCDPQDSESPTTVFRFADNVVRDRVAVEVWRGSQRVAQSEVAVKFDEERARRSKEQTPEVEIEITSIPPYEQGGPDTRADIVGKVGGKLAPEYKVVLYVRAYNSWHIQPMAQSVHSIRPDNTFTSWTHTGTSYAALLVRPEFDAFARLDMLPQVGGYVLARTIVDGKKK